MPSRRPATPPDAANAHDAIRGLAKWQLERDDVSDPNGRIYRDANGEVYHSVTRILKETSNSKAALAAWVARLGEELANVERNTAAERGTSTHNAAEYVLRSAKKLAIGAANKRGTLYEKPDGLIRTPAPLTHHTTPSLPYLCQIEALDNAMRTMLLADNTRRIGLPCHSRR